MTEPMLIDNDRIKIVDNVPAIPESMWEGVDFGPGSGFAWYENDFFTYAAGDWTVTETDAGATEALSDEVGGVLLLTNTATENDVLGMQLGAEAFLLAGGKNIYFETRFKASEATNMDWLVGLCDTDTGLPMAAVSDGIYFVKDDGGTGINCGCSTGSVESIEASAATFEADTYITLGFKVIGTSKVEFWKDGSKLTEITTNIPTAELRLSIAIGAGSTDARTANVDYVKAAQQR